MLRKDLHGYTKEQAIRKVDEIVSLIRMTKSDNIRIEFITGSGIIRETVINTLRGYDLDPHLQWGNQGVVVCLVE